MHFFLGALRVKQDVYTMHQHRYNKLMLKVFCMHIDNTPIIFDTGGGGGGGIKICCFIYFLDQFQRDVFLHC